MLTLCRACTFFSNVSGVLMTQPRSKDDRCGVLFRTYAYPAPYPEDTRSTRIREEMVFTEYAVMCIAAG